MPIEPPDPHELTAFDALRTAVRELGVALARHPGDARLTVAFAQATAAVAVLGLVLDAPATKTQA